MTHVIWDWNGTLLDDLHVVVNAVNVSLEPFGAGPIGADDYRDHYTRPVYRFYERLLGRVVTAAEWESIDVTFHAAYRAQLGNARLTADASAALDRVARCAGTQSLLSMWWHEELVPAVRGHGIADRMVRIDGNRGEAGETKARHLEKHLAALAADLGSVDTDDCVVVGDSLDDAVAAHTVGVPCVLYDGGSHHRRELDAAGAPVAADLIEALTIAGLG